MTLKEAQLAVKVSKTIYEKNPTSQNKEQYDFDHK